MAMRLSVHEKSTSRAAEAEQERFDEVAVPRQQTEHGILS
jgi:hypothetical protein